MEEDSGRTFGVMSVRPEILHEKTIFGFLDSIPDLFSGSGIYSGIGGGEGEEKQKIEQNKNEHRTKVEHLRTKIEQNCKIFLINGLYFLLFTIFD